MRIKYIEAEEIISKQYKEKWGGFYDETIENFNKVREGLKPTPDGTSYMYHVEDLMTPISNMEWYRESGWRIPERREDVYDRELKIIQDAREDIKERIKNSVSKEAEDAYKALDAYLFQKIYFDKPLYENAVRQAYNKVMRTKAGRFFLSKAIDWIREILPGVIVGGVLTMAGTVWGILQIAQDMGKAVISKGKNAVNELSKKLKELAKKQNAPIRAILTGVAGVLGLGAAGLNFIEEHFWWFVITLTVVMILGIIALIVGRRGRGRVRIRRDSEDEDD